MLDHISRVLHRTAKGWLILLLFLLNLVFDLLILPLGQALMKSDAGGPGPIDLLFLYPPSKAYAMVASYGEYGRAFYRNFELSVDILYPVIYTLLLCLLISWLFRRAFPQSSRWQRWNVLPLGAWLFDLLENLGIVGMLSVFPGTPAILGWLTSAFTFIKWLFVAGSFGLVLIGFWLAVRNKFKFKSKS